MIDSNLSIAEWMKDLKLVILEIDFFLSGIVWPKGWNTSILRVDVNCPTSVTGWHRVSTTKLSHIVCWWTVLWEILFAFTESRSMYTVACLLTSYFLLFGCSMGIFPYESRQYTHFGSGKPILLFQQHRPLISAIFWLAPHENINSLDCIRSISIFPAFSACHYGNMSCY